MVKHRCTWDPGHQEKPERFSVTLNRIQELGLVNRCLPLEPRKASVDDLLLIHTQDYVNEIKKTDQQQDEVMLEREASKYDAVYFHPTTYELALYAAGSGIQLVDNILTGNVTNGFALIRPPGHHAMASEACGYCFFNNVAIAAQFALNQHHLDRILIVDWDAHHGQATQFSFYDDPRVMYVSIHRYENGSFWPNLKEGNFNWSGGDSAKGYNINIPLNETGMNDRDYFCIFHNVILPIAYNFNPQLVLISAGYDAAFGCPEGEMVLSPAVYSHLTKCLMSLAGGRVGVFFEGGYCVESLSEGAAHTLSALLGDAPPFLLSLPKPIHGSLVSSILDVSSEQSQYWPNAFPLLGHITRPTTRGSERKAHIPVVTYVGTVEVKPTSYATRNTYPIQSTNMRRQIIEHLDWLKDNTPFRTRGKTGIVYSDSMLKHRDIGHHYEKPARIKKIYCKLVEENLIDKCIELQASPVEESILLLGHCDQYVRSMKSLKGLPRGKRNDMAGSFQSVYLNENTYESAIWAVGSVIKLVDSVMTDECLNGYAIVRPPGHHAAREKASGFCIFNNVAIGALYSIEKYSMRKVLVIDLDIHFGDGTANILKDREDILFISIHRFDKNNFFPFDNLGSIDEGPSNVLNIPWNTEEIGDSEYMSALLNIVMPVATDFNPDLVFISCGLDACDKDPLGGYQVTPPAFGHMIHHLSTLAGGRLITTLEGGYNLDSISSASMHVVSSLLGQPSPPLPLKSVNPQARETLRMVVDHYKGRWPSLQFSVDILQPGN